VVFLTTGVARPIAPDHVIRAIETDNKRSVTQATEVRSDKTSTNRAPVVLEGLNATATLVGRVTSWQFDPTKSEDANIADCIKTHNEFEQSFVDVSEASTL